MFHAAVDKITSWLKLWISSFILELQFSCNLREQVIFTNYLAIMHFKDSFSNCQVLKKIEVIKQSTHFPSCLDSAFLNGYISSNKHTKPQQSFFFFFSKKGKYRKIHIITCHIYTITKKLREEHELASPPKLNVFHMVSGQWALQEEEKIWHLGLQNEHNLLGSFSVMVLDAHFNSD